MPDQMLMYDTAVRTWIQTQFGSLQLPKILYLMVGTADRAFAEYVTPTGLSPDGRPPLPRISLTLGDAENDPDRHNPGTIRKLGYVDTTERTLRRAEYPVSVKLPYTLNFWAEYQREMNLYVQQLLKLFRFQYVYIPVNIDSISLTPVYGTKSIGLFMDGAITDSGELEPGAGERILRRTFAFHAKAWIWDLDFLAAYTVKQVELKFYRDSSLSTLLEISSTPSTYVMFTGTGAQLAFSGSLDPSRLPVIQNTFFVDATVSGANVRGFDNGTGTIIGTGVSGALDYNTGSISLLYSAAPDVLTSITVGYHTTVT